MGEEEVVEIEVVAQFQEACPGTLFDALYVFTDEIVRDEADGAVAVLVGVADEGIGDGEHACVDGQQQRRFVGTDDAHLDRLHPARQVFSGNESGQLEAAVGILVQAAAIAPDGRVEGGGELGAAAVVEAVGHVDVRWRPWQLTEDVEAPLRGQWIQDVPDIVTDAVIAVDVAFDVVVEDTPMMQAGQKFAHQWMSSLVACRGQGSGWKLPRPAPAGAAVRLRRLDPQAPRNKDTLQPVLQRERV